MRVYFKTFGCRVNQYETEGLRERLLSDGVSTAVSDFAAADLCVVNTCTVTREADRDALTLVRRIARRNPAARLVVTGCYATRAPQEIQAAAPAALVVSNAQKASIPALLGCRPAPDEAGLKGFAGRSRAFVKVQDGCNMHCAYCIIPSVRPELSSKPYPLFEREARGLIEAGYAEIVLCGVRLGRYLSQDPAGRRVDFPGLLERLLSLPGEFRVRLSSFEITDVTERFLDVFEAAGGRLCPSFHLPLQSGSEAVLRRMERWYTAAFYRRRVEALRSRRPDAALFADVMTGFPGETREEHEESLRFVEDLGYAGLHVFRYSRRAGTSAARRRDQVPEADVLARAQEFRALDERLRAAFAASFVGREVRVVPENGLEAMTEHFLRVDLDRRPGPGLHRARVTRAEGPSASASLVH